MGRKKNSRLPELNPKYPPMELGGEVHQDVWKRHTESKWRGNWGQVGICLRMGACKGYPIACCQCFKHSCWAPKVVGK